MLTANTDTFIPPIPKHRLVLALGDRRRCHTYRARLQSTQHILVINNNLVNDRLTVSFYHTNGTIALVSGTTDVLTSLVPPRMDDHLRRQLARVNIRLLLGSRLRKLRGASSNVLTALSHRHDVRISTMVTTAKLHPRATLTQHTKLAVGHNIYISDCLRADGTSVCTLNSYTRVGNRMLPFLRPVRLDTVILTGGLLNGGAPLGLPTVLIGVGAPRLPLRLTNRARHRSLH